jgi:threonine/homoserine/homoserine lactone efflux protein
MDWQFILLTIVVGVGIFYWEKHLSLRARLSDAMPDEPKVARIIRLIVAFLLLGVGMFFLLKDLIINN